MPDLFVSYSRDDKCIVKPVLKAISDADLNYWIDESDILPAMSFNEEILNGLRSCKWYLIVLSPRSAESEYVKDELHWALTHRKRRILPVMVEPCDPADFHLRLLQIQYLDLQEHSAESMAKLRLTLSQVKSATAEDSLHLESQCLEEDLEVISLLLTFIPRTHQKHLRNLRPERERQQYQGRRSVRRELRDLCEWGLLKRQPGVTLGSAAPDGERFLLSDVVQLTHLGKRLAKHVA